MRILVSLLAACALYACCPHKPLAPATFEWPATHAVVPLAYDSGAVAGSAVTIRCVGNTSFALTAKHLMASHLRAYQRLPDGSYPVVTRVVDHAVADLTLVSWPGRCARSVAIAPTDPRAGEDIVIVGSPGGRPGTMSGGTINYVTLDAGWRRICVDATIISGSSGGALFNKYGHLIGIVSYRYNNPMLTVGCAVHTSHLREMYNGMMSATVPKNAGAK